MADAARTIAVRLLPPVAILIFAGTLGVLLLSALSAGTFACDYLVYDEAIRRFLGGGALYLSAGDPGGPCGSFQYPPPLVLLALPLMALPPSIDAWIATIGDVAAVLGGIALFPVSARTRWLVLLLAGLSWPTMYALKLAQVGPILLLVFVIGWRWMDRPIRVGAAIAIGAIVKIQPGLLLIWAFVTGRARAVLVAVAILAVLSIAVTLAFGPRLWLDEIELLASRSTPLATAGLVTPGRVAIEAGLPEGLALAIQLGSWALAVVLVAIVLVRGSAVAAYMAFVVASQFLSPILWEHYAIVLLVPVAWLLGRGRWWAMVIPLLSSVPLVLITPIVVYPIEYLGTLVLVVIEGVAEARRRPSTRAWRLLRSVPPPDPPESAEPALG
ncbi:MAG TPA: glycosyltransferase 87 family protein [Candidatus Limnocylindrales bacterium]|nr:glycosyltransferase 87 family protein [Candidatus Limnocylindrales bacterium]